MRKKESNSQIRFIDGLEKKNRIMYILCIVSYSMDYNNNELTNICLNKLNESLAKVCVNEN